MGKLRPKEQKGLSEITSQALAQPSLEPSSWALHSRYPSTTYSLLPCPASLRLHAVSSREDLGSLPPLSSSAQQLTFREHLRHTKCRARAVLYIISFNYHNPWEVVINSFTRKESET